MLVTYRPEYEHAWGRRSYYTRLSIDTLPPEGTAQLLAALLGANGGLQPVKRRLTEHGNPFFVEETIRALVDDKVLEGEPGRYRLTRPVEALQPPPTVNALLAARIDRLPPDAKQLLQAASVIGNDVPHRILETIADLPAPTLRRGLAQLQEAEFLLETSVFPERSYTFKHAITYEVAYGTLLRERRRGLHARILAEMERFWADRLSEHVEQLGRHARDGEVWDKAATYLRQAGIKSFSRGANREAVGWLGWTVDALARLPETPDTVAAAVDVRCEISNALTVLGEHERAFEHLREAEALAEASNDGRRLARVCSLVSRWHMVVSANDAALEAGLRALHLAEAAVGGPRHEQT